jgi:Protein of unknown function (DUF2490)
MMGFVKNVYPNPVLRKYFCRIGIFMCTTSCSFAQTKSTQLWTDFTINKMLQKGYSFDCEFSYRTNVGDADKWHSLNITPKIEKALDKHLDLMFYMGSINTLQQAGDNTWELRPSLGVRYHFMPFNKLMLRVLVRFELRNQYNIDSSIWSHDLRSRFRLEGTYFVNGHSYADNHLWYLLSDLEFFTTVDKELQERYSNRSLLRLGLGYKLSEAWRFESILTYQYSKNTIDGEFSNEDEGIVRLRFRYTIL